MKVIDWVGVVLIGGVVVGGAAFYFVKMRPLQPQVQAGNGVPVPVVGQGQNFVQPVQPQHPATGGGTQTGNDVIGTIGALGGLATSLFPNGIGGLFGN